MLTHDSDTPDHAKPDQAHNFTPQAEAAFATGTSFQTAAPQSKNQPLTPANVLSLQRTIGNQATMRLIKSQQAGSQTTGVQRVLGRDAALEKFRNAGKLAQYGRHFDNRYGPAPKDTDKGEAILDGLKSNPDNITDPQVYALMMLHKGKLDWLEKELDDKEKAGGDLDQIRKIVPEWFVMSQLKRDSKPNVAYGGPSLGGFFAAGKYSDDISAEQTISKFGLDYAMDNNGVEETPYLTKGPNNDYTPIGLVFYLQGDFTKAIFNQTRIPFDPTIVDKFKAELARQEEIITTIEGKRDQNGNLEKGQQNILDRAMDMHSLVSKVINRGVLKYKNSPDRSQEVKDKIEETKEANKKYNFTTTQSDAPYAGTGFAQSGDRMEGSPFKHVAMTQEFFTDPTKPTPLNAGAGLYAKGPLLNGAAQPDIKLAEWDGNTWNLAVNSPADLAWIRNNDADRVTFFQQLQDALAVGLAKMVPPVQAVQNQPQPVPTQPQVPNPSQPVQVQAPVQNQPQTGRARSNASAQQNPPAPNLLAQQNVAQVPPVAPPMAPANVPPAATSKLKLIKKKLVNIFKRKKK